MNHIILGFSLEELVKLATNEFSESKLTGKLSSLRLA